MGNSVAALLNAPRVGGPQLAVMAALGLTVGALSVYRHYFMLSGTVRPRQQQQQQQQQ